MQAQGQREILYRGRKFDFERVSLPGPSGQLIVREVIRHPGAVCIVPLLEGGAGEEARLVMIRNVRPAVEKRLIEFPAGTLEAGEQPSVCAARELIEETGYEASSLKPIGTFYTTPGMTDELMRAFFARGLKHVGQKLEADEDITVLDVPVSEALAMMDRGELMDGKSMLSLLLAIRKGLVRGSPTTGTNG